MEPGEFITSSERELIVRDGNGVVCRFSDPTVIDDDITIVRCELTAPYLSCSDDIEFLPKHHDFALINELERLHDAPDDLRPLDHRSVHDQLRIQIEPGARGTHLLHVEVRDARHLQRRWQGSITIEVDTQSLRRIADGFRILLSCGSR